MTDVAPTRVMLRLESQPNAHPFRVAYEKLRHYRACSQGQEEEQEGMPGDPGGS